MSDETPVKPLMPKRPYTVKAAPVPAEVKPPSKKMSKKKVEEVEHQSTLLTMQEKACALIAIEKGSGVAAEQLGLGIDEVDRILDSEPVRFFLRELQQAELADLAKRKTKRLFKVGISRTAIEERLFELMQMDPDRTKGNIDGQVKAAAALADKFGYAGKEDPLAGKTPEELAAIVREGHDLIAKGATSVN